MANVQYYDVILKPVVTEKSMNAMSEKKYTFLEMCIRDRSGMDDPARWATTWKMYLKKYSD